MAVELVVPSVGESISEVEIGDWLKSPGESVDQDEPVVVIETEKATVELPAPAAGTITQMLKHKGEKAAVGDVIGYLEPNGNSPAQVRREEPKRRAGSGRAVQENDSADQHPPVAPPQPSSAGEGSLDSNAAAPIPQRSTGREEQVIPMTPIRRRIA